MHRCKRPVADLFELPCFPAYDPAQRRRILRYLRRHRRVVRGWIKVVLGQGGRDPWATVKARMRDVLLRTDLWSDQILVLRAVQSLTMLDLQHNCELVWNLGRLHPSRAGRHPNPTPSPRGSPAPSRGPFNGRDRVTPIPGAPEPRTAGCHRADSVYPPNFSPVPVVVC